MSAAEMVTSLIAGGVIGVMSFVVWVIYGNVKFFMKERKRRNI